MILFRVCVCHSNLQAQSQTTSTAPHYAVFHIQVTPELPTLIRLVGNDSHVIQSCSNSLRVPSRWINWDKLLGRRHGGKRRIPCLIRTDRPRAIPAGPRRSRHTWRNQSFGSRTVCDTLVFMLMMRLEKWRRSVALQGYASDGCLIYPNRNASIPAMGNHRSWEA